MKKVITSLFITAALASAVVAGESENFGGLGISVWTGKSGVKIAGVLPNTPAESIGLQAGDLIVSANEIKLSSVEPREQVSHLRGKAGTLVNLTVDRNGEIISVSTKRVNISVQSMDESEISGWYGKSQGLTTEELNFLASQKTEEGYQLLGVMQYGMLIPNAAENLNAASIQQISVKKAENAKLPEAKPVQYSTPDMSSTKDFSLVNVKGAKVNKPGNVPVYIKR
jgi:membrane-associated protease RseP (regulator of RpoE activity)